ncbi:hypothetical protein PPERSA_01101 [Pseudocohnilembus persalinus]|uniref:Uncharacterized protein n=1 Tax=Pseudocohnilembus persalinus TaxID=266149 RepID=A0A0V0QUU6_PSEPJ|nr:hypothetical protein PPERSA_01101 [Pseudocohnilembus persalinus]|eukprot:KRX06023.1 hypothetical protein PPERSA_01101 [Pseudocohnilembus persalinus]
MSHYKSATKQQYNDNLKTGEKNSTVQFQHEEDTPQRKVPLNYKSPHHNNKSNLQLKIQQKAQNFYNQQKSFNLVNNLEKNFQKITQSQEKVKHLDNNISFKNLIEDQENNQENIQDYQNKGKNNQKSNQENENDYLQGSFAKQNYNKFAQQSPQQIIENGIWNKFEESFQKQSIQQGDKNDKYSNQFKNDSQYQQSLLDDNQKNEYKQPANDSQKNINNFNVSPKKMDQNRFIQLNYDYNQQKKNIQSAEIKKNLNQYDDENEDEKLKDYLKKKYLNSNNFQKKGNSDYQNTNNEKVNKRVSNYEDEINKQSQNQIQSQTLQDQNNIKNTKNNYARYDLKPNFLFKNQQNYSGKENDVDYYQNQNLSQQKEQKQKIQKQQQFLDKQNLELSVKLNQSFNEKQKILDSYKKQQQELQNQSNFHSPEIFKSQRQQNRIDFLSSIPVKGKNEIIEVDNKFFNQQNNQDSQNVKINIDKQQDQQKYQQKNKFFDQDQNLFEVLKQIKQKQTSCTVYESI